MRKLLLIIIWSSILANTTAFWNLPDTNARNILCNMSLKEKVAQLFMVGLHSYNTETEKKDFELLVKKYQIGSIIFMSGKLENQLQQANYYQSLSKIPILYSQDNEWGRVVRMPELLKFPNSMTIGAIQDHDAIYSLGAEFARRCKLSGISLNLAPVVDINSNPLNPVINNRSFGEHKRDVAKKSTASIKGMQENGILACAKHFPGHGDVNIDSHLNYPTINKSLEKLIKTELYPFRKAISANVQAIMIAHILLPKLDNTVATLSKEIITNLLRKEIGFKGLIITDSISMDAIAKYYSIEKASLKALQAGNDMVIICEAQISHQQTINVINAIKHICKAVKNGEITEQEIDEKVTRILLAKEWCGLFDNRYCNSEVTVNDINNRQAKKLLKELYYKSTTLVKNEQHIIPFSTLESEPTLYIQVGGKSSSPFYKQLKRYRDIESIEISTNPDNEEISECKEHINVASTVVIGLYDMNSRAKDNWGLSDGIIELINSTEKKVILVIFGSPYSLKHFPNIKTIVMAYEDAKDAQIAAAKTIGGEHTPEGTLPISIQNKYKYSVKKLTVTRGPTPPLPLEDLRLVKLTHWDFDGNIKQGKLIVHKLVVDDVINIFRELFEIQYPINKMSLIENYQDESDSLSILDNNSYAFCARYIAKQDKWSNHAYGTAIDINPIQNPYIQADPKCFHIEPLYVSGQINPYLDRNLAHPAMITEESPIYKIFKSYGWEWGGESFIWCRDLHHFQKNISFST